MNLIATYTGRQFGGIRDGMGSHQYLLAGNQGFARTVIAMGAGIAGAEAPEEARKPGPVRSRNFR